MPQPPEQTPAEPQAFLAVSEWQPGAGLSLPVDAEIEPRFLAAPAIAIEFPAFNDGRGLSLAVALRRRHNYRGRLVAAGAVHPELDHYLKRCGFDAAHYPSDEDGIPEAPHEGYYQGSVRNPGERPSRQDTSPSTSPISPPPSH